MNDEEAFIRAIVSAPQDEAPRLIYADWLEERDDPRGQFLRAEVVHFRDQPDDEILVDSVRLLQAWRETLVAATLWVARISRPPVGICCDRVRFHEHGSDRTRPALTIEALDAIEGRFGITLPTDYRAFLLNVNGGVPSPGICVRPNGGWFRVTHFHSVWSEDGTSRYDERDLIRRLERTAFREEAFARQRFEIAHQEIYTEQRVYLAWTGELAGRVYLAYPFDRPEQIAILANSFAEFLGMFVDPIEDDAA